MDKKESEFRKRLLATFKAEAQDHVRTISAGLFELEKDPPIEVRAEIVETIFRDSHSLKGAARAVNMAEIESVCQSVEGVFAAWKKKGVIKVEGVFDPLYLAVETIKALLKAIDSGSQPDKRRCGLLTKELSDWEDRIRSMPAAEEQVIHLGEGPRDMEHPASGAKKARLSEPVSGETIRVSTSKLNSLLLQAEEMLAVKLFTATQASALKEVSLMIEALRAQCSQAYVDSKPGSANGPDRAARYDKIHDHFSSTQSSLKAIHSRLLRVIRSSSQGGKALERMVDGLLGDVKETMLLPFSSLLEILPMLIRDIAHEQAKEAELSISGEAIEIDRRILEELKDPFIHLARNSLDHGIEAPRTRIEKGKPGAGHISVKIAYASGDKVRVTVSDDGCGIDVARVKEAAVKNGAISEDAAQSLDDSEALQLIFHSGVSTSPIITDLSGRGLGLAIVRENVEKLGGSVVVESSSRGTSFNMELPLTIATFRGILASVADQPYIIPTPSVERTLRVKREEIKTVENRDTIRIGDEPVSFARLDDLLEVPSGRTEAGPYQQAIIISASNKRLALGVDEVMGEQEVLIKHLGKQLVKVRNISGAALLGTGKPIPVLNTADLVRSAGKVSGRAITAEAAATPAVRKTVLVVEDSITSRILLKNILESSGYDVKTAVDGIDAITLLRTEPVSLVVADIEMPRMNGFDLTSKIRSDKKLSELPVVLVTSLESKEDKEKGIEAGANAYIVKSSFDQGNLIEIVRRLI